MVAETRALSGTAKAISDLLSSHQKKSAELLHTQRSKLQSEKHPFAKRLLVCLLFNWSCMRALV
jgi:hypothetical protein